MVPEKKLVTYTALALVATHDVDSIQQIRSKYDPAFQRWPPHINISFPFVAPDRFDDIYNGLSEALNDFEQFDITVTEINSFPHGVIFCKPVTFGNQLQKLYDRIMEQYPELINKKHKGFTPHLTLANKISSGEIDKLKDQFQATWQEWKWRVQGIHFLERGKDTPFHTAKFLPFKTQE